jgi:hypothetical protein
MKRKRNTRAKIRCVQSTPVNPAILTASAARPPTKHVVNRLCSVHPFHRLRTSFVSTLMAIALFLSPQGQIVHTSTGRGCVAMHPIVHTSCPAAARPQTISRKYRMSRRPVQPLLLRLGCDPFLGGICFNTVRAVCVSRASARARAGDGPVHSSVWLARVVSGHPDASRAWLVRHRSVRRREQITHVTASRSARNCKSLRFIDAAVNHTVPSIGVVSR